MLSIELRIALTEDILQELLWRALTPAAIVLLPELNAAIERERAQRGVTLTSLQLSGISVVIELDGPYAELTYTAPPEKA